MIQKFKCQRCGGTELDYEKMTTIRADVVVHDDGHVEYGKFHVTDEDIEKIGASLRHALKEVTS